MSVKAPSDLSPADGRARLRLIKARRLSEGEPERRVAERGKADEFLAEADRLE
jgi:hypothetical protein